MTLIEILAVLQKQTYLTSRRKSQQGQKGSAVEVIFFIPLIDSIVLTMQLRNEESHLPPILERFQPSPNLELFFQLSTSCDDGQPEKQSKAFPYP